MRIGGLGLSPSDPCYDPNHPWVLPNAFATAFECKCLADSGDHSPCSPWWGGTPVDYSGTNTGVIENIAAAVGETAGDVVAGTANAVATGAGAAAESLNFGGYATLAALLLGAVVVLPMVLNRR